MVPKTYSLGSIERGKSLVEILAQDTLLAIHILRSNREHVMDATQVPSVCITHRPVIFARGSVELAKLTFNMDVVGEARIA